MNHTDSLGNDGRRHIPSAEATRIMQRNRTFATISAVINGLSTLVAFVLGTLPAPLLEHWDTTWGWSFVVGTLLSWLGAGQNVERQFDDAADARRAAGAIMAAACIGIACAVLGWVAILWLNL
jgi:Na+/proline symporter